MNINRYRMKGLLNLALIISIFLGVSNSISAKSGDLSNATSGDVKKKDNQPTGDSNNSNPGSSEPSAQPTPQVKNSTDTQTTESSKSTESSEALETKTTDDQKMLTINDILLFINLLILTTLSLLWFLNQKKQQQQIDRFTKNQNKLIDSFSQFNEITNKLNNLEKINLQIIEKIQDSDQKYLDSEVRLREFLSKQQFNQSVNYHNGSTPDISHFNSTTIVDKISQLVETYNQDKTSLSNKAIATVAETQESLNQRRSGNSEIVTLENTTQKKYCIIEEDNDYYLIPHAKIKIDEYNTKTLESLFDCMNFSSDYCDLKLVKPAKVFKNNSGFWQLEEKGKLEFYKSFYS